MNDILLNVMTFINEHTLLLIGICVFLILVLVGYLIDNSVKSKRIRNDIKNKDQVPKNIKDEIIKEAEDKKIIKESENTIDNNVQMQTVDLQANSETTNNGDITFKINEPKEEISNINFDATDNNTNIENNNDLNLDLNTSNDILNIEIPKSSQSTKVNEDPDANIMMPEIKNEYTNDKKLSEILFNNSYTNDVTNNIFNNDSTSGIVINNEVNKDDVQIQNNDSNDELDRIMRKLSTMNEKIDDDNYTNIF